MYPELGQDRSPPVLAGDRFCMRHRGYSCIPVPRRRHLCPRCLCHFGSSSLFVAFGGARLLRLVGRRRYSRLLSLRLRLLRFRGRGGQDRVVLLISSLRLGRGFPSGRRGGRHPGGISVWHV